VLLLLAEVLFFGLALTLKSNETLTVGNQEGLEVCEKILFGHTGIPVEKEEQLAFHEVDFR
jgi:hypothetical protein